MSEKVYSAVMAQKRKSAQDWIDAGLKALAMAGPTSLKAEPLARAMKTTKGSFYWHFKDLPEFMSFVAQEWKRRAAGAIVTTLEGDESVSAQLSKMGPGAGTEASLERSMRAWAQVEPTAAEAVAEIDALRLSATQALLSEVGISNPDLANAIYATQVGLDQVSGLKPAQKDGAAGSLIDVVLALR